MSAPPRTVPTTGESPLRDRWGRTHTDLRLSVTDRCNLRCFYCVPSERTPLLPREALLHFDEIVHVVQVAVRLGIRKVRLTGGEPLLRKNLPSLVGDLAAIPGLADLAMTTNATLLADYAQLLRQAGLQRLNISLDTLDRRQFEALTGRDALEQVLRGIEAAQSAHFWPIKLNALAMRDFSESQIVPLVRFALERGLEIRFIEFMPIVGPGRWSPDRVLPSEAILNILREEFGSVEPVDSPEDSPSAFNPEENLSPRSFSGTAALAPAQQYLVGRHGVRVGLIASVSRPFCRSCCRLRLNAVGELRNCLFASTGWDVGSLLRRGGSDQELIAMFLSAVQDKPFSPGPLLDHRPQSHLVMRQIGG